MKDIVINNKSIQFEKQGEQIFCTSLDIAEVFEKRHDHILETIDNKIKNLREIGEEQCIPNFRESYEYRKIEGFKGVAKYRYYKLNRDAFSLIAMSLTGTKALKWQVQFPMLSTKWNKHLKYLRKKNS
ncbi:putative phage anti-repressor protein [Helicobacter fennelliae]|uniref:Putative phage anti-repressor protein n=1 Tax=Helicobacter fennelliae TaxID=215 RepID=A0A2X3EJ67_9HELI|nr:Rha family transcriptional regulator [Helicobacter fennelliae]SQC36501.1 putative phage anti-repressor protein [Helicobacter fennelliae]